MMSSGKAASSSKVVSIPESVKKMIQNIKEITSAHDDFEIYATLKECDMDPNETAQKLLSQDTFHEVKSKRDKRKENMSNKEPVDSKWKAGQGRGGRGGRGNYSARYVATDNSGRNAPVGKENPSDQAPLKNTGRQLSSSSQEPIQNEPAAAARTAPVIANGSSAIVSKVSKAPISKSAGPAPLENINIKKENLKENSGMRKAHGKLTSSSSDSSAAETQASSPGAHFSSSDPVLVPSHDSRIPGAAGTIKREVRRQQNPPEQISALSSKAKTNAATSEVGKNQQSDTTVRPSSAHGGSSGVRPSSNHSSRSQQVVGPPKGSAKEWKAKPSNATFIQGPSMTGQAEVSAPMEVNTQSRPVRGDLDSKGTTTKLEAKLEELHIPNNQHVIVPNHLYVPGAEKVSFRFGSFDAISIDTSFKNAPCDSSPAPPLETYQNVEETAEETSSLENVLATTEETAHHDHPQTPEVAAERLSPNEHEVPSAGTQVYGETKPESDLGQGSHQFPMVHPPPSYGFGLVPTMMGSQLPPFEGSDSQGREIPNVPSFLVQQAFDPTNYYGQIYRPATEGDGRISPFHAASVATKYNGGVAMLPPQTSPSAPEGGNSSAMSTAGPNAFVTQPAQVQMPNSISLTQQSLPVYRQPYGIPISQYPPHNYVHYPYHIPPYFFPHFNPSLGNSVYPQQPQAAAGVYPAPPGQSPKFSLPQYKPGTSAGNSTNVGVASSYGQYGPSGSTTGNSSPNEDLNAQQFKENNMYMAGQQQSEGSTVWLTPSGREMPGVQATSYYSIPSHQGQVAFPQPQPGHGPFAGIYHSGQSVSASPGQQQLLQQSQTMASNVDVGPPPNVYQQSQHAQMTWPNNNY